MSANQGYLNLLIPKDISIPFWFLERRLKSKITDRMDKSKKSGPDISHNYFRQAGKHCKQSGSIYRFPETFQG